MNNKDTAVITIDMQEEFLKDFIGRQDVINFLIKQQVSVLEKAVEKNIPVVIVESVHPYGERDYGETDFKIMDSVRNYAPTGNYYKAIKKILCAFEDENLDGWLKRKNVVILICKFFIIFFFYLFIRKKKKIFFFFKKKKNFF